MKTDSEEDGIEGIEGERAGDHWGSQCRLTYADDDRVFRRTRTNSIINVNRIIASRYHDDMYAKSYWVV